MRRRLAMDGRGDVVKWETVTSRVSAYQGDEVEHPDLDWARECVRANKGDRVTEEELETLWWNPLMGCYLMGWRGMTLGIETDGHIHS